MLLFSDMLYMMVRYASPSGPMSFSCPMELFLLYFGASWTCVVVGVTVIVCSLGVSYLCDYLCLLFV